MKKKWIIWGVAALAVALVVLAAFLIPRKSTPDNRIVINGVAYERNITNLDLSGKQNPDIQRLSVFRQLQMLDLRNTMITAKDYDMLQQALPKCRILWSIPLDGTYYDSDCTEIAVQNLSQEDIDILKYFTTLNKLDALGCDDYEQLIKAQEIYPDISVLYQVQLGQMQIQSDSTALTLEKADVQALLDVLGYLPKLKSVTLNGDLPDADSLKLLADSFPDLEFHWKTEAFDREIGTETVELDLSGIKMKTTDDVEAILGYMPYLQRVIMCECGISNEDMDALNNRYPDIRFVWTVYVGWHKVRTDATTFMPVKAKLMMPYGNQCDVLKYCVDMEAIDLGHCEITNCSFVAYMPNIKYLILALTNISDLSPLANREKLVYLELFTCPYLKDYTPLLTLKNLEDLNICYTWGDIEIIAQMTWLKNLWWSPGPQRWGQVKTRKDILSERLPNTYLELDTVSSTGDGWRELPNYYKQRDIFEMPYFYD